MILPGPLAILLTLAAACGGGGGTQQPADDTAREISNDELGRMVLSLQQLPPEYSGFEPYEHNGVKTQAGGFFAVADRRAESVKFGWASGYDAIYKEAGQGLTGVTLVDSDAELYRTGDGASNDFKSAEAQLSQSVGKTKVLSKVVKFDAAVADEAAGFLMEFSMSSDSSSGHHIWLVTIGFRHGRVIAYVSIGANNLSDNDMEHLKIVAKDLARKLNDQITAVLAVATPSGG